MQFRRRNLAAATFRPRRRTTRMSEKRTQYLLLGGGVAAAEAAAAIREIDPAGSILLVGREVNRPYDRRAVNKSYLRRAAGRADLALRPDGWYADHHIELHTNQRATSLEVGRRRVTLDSGEAVGFERLLIATGAAPAKLDVPGGDLPAVYPLWTLEQADAIHRAAESARPFTSGRRPVRACVVGGGMNGAEAAATLAGAGLAVEWVAGHRGPLGPVAGEAAQRSIKRLFAENGVGLRDGRAAAVEGDGRAQRVVTTGGEAVACDLVVHCVGMKVNRALLRGSPVAAETAILADVQGQTNVPGVYAAGDVAAWFDPRFGKHRPVSHWGHAAESGLIAGKNMAGAWAAWAGDDGYSVELFGRTLWAWGDARRIDRRLLRGGGESFAEIGVEADGRVAFVLSVGREAENVALRALVDTRASTLGREESLKDAATAL